MNWLIVEDALRDRKGHWFEYVGTFARGLRALGDDASILADHTAEPFLIEQLHAQPVLPDSIWHQMSDGSGAWRRYARLPLHACRTYHAVERYLRNRADFDVIFVPTMLVHHLLGWVGLIKRVINRKSARVILFFPNTPVRLDLETNEPSWQPAPTSRLFLRLIRSLKQEVERGQVVLGVETHPMREALTRLTGVRFTYFPHPVDCEKDEYGRQNGATGGILTFGSYGGARHEKGSDILVTAVDRYCRENRDSRARFVLQNVDGDAKLWERLNREPRVQLIPHYFANGQYGDQLGQTDALLLPYRRSSYCLRVSRVVIEAMVRAIPVVTTSGTTLQSQAEEFGAAYPFDDQSADSLFEAIRGMEQHFLRLKERAERRKAKAREHFSVKNFVAIALGDVSHVPDGTGDEGCQIDRL